ncbi:MAG: hypothetical protein HQL35_08230 [Alphaproteobacteria bacterium]|nr:hypothetical protein [Alphaproteobacteria bacterium]
MFDQTHSAVEFALAVRNAAGKDMAYTAVPGRHGSGFGLAEVYDGEEGFRHARAPIFDTELEALAAAGVMNTALGITPDRATELLRGSFPHSERSCETCGAEKPTQCDVCWDHQNWRLITSVSAQDEPTCPKCGFAGLAAACMDPNCQGSATVKGDTDANS